MWGENYQRKHGLGVTIIRVNWDWVKIVLTPLFSLFFIESPGENISS